MSFHVGDPILASDETSAWYRSMFVAVGPDPTDLFVGEDRGFMRLRRMNADGTTTILDSITFDRNRTDGSKGAVRHGFGETAWMVVDFAFDAPTTIQGFWWDGTSIQSTPTATFNGAMRQGGMRVVTDGTDIYALNRGEVGTTTVVEWWSIDWDGTSTAPVATLIDNSVQEYAPEMYNNPRFDANLNLGEVVWGSANSSDVIDGIEFYWREFPLDGDPSASTTLFTDVYDSTYSNPWSVMSHIGDPVIVRLTSEGPTTNTDDTFRVSGPYTYEYSKYPFSEITSGGPFQDSFTGVTDKYSIMMSAHDVGLERPLVFVGMGRENPSLNDLGDGLGISEEVIYGWDPITGEREEVWVIPPEWRGSDFGYHYYFNVERPLVTEGNIHWWWGPWDIYNDIDTSFMLPVGYAVPDFRFEGFGTGPRTRRMAFRRA